MSGGRITPAVLAARQAGIAHAIHEYEHDARAESYGEEAASALGLEPSRVFKTLVAKLADGRLAVGVVPVPRRLDLKALARCLGARSAAMAEASDAQRATGYVLGGISPLGEKKGLPIVLDESARSWDTVFVSAGRRGLEIELRPGDLCELTAATLAPIARGG